MIGLLKGSEKLPAKTEKKTRISKISIPFISLCEIVPRDITIMARFPFRFYIALAAATK